MHQSSMELMRSFVQRYLAPHQDRSLTILDLGAMDVNGSYRELMTGAS